MDQNGIKYCCSILFILEINSKATLGICSAFPHFVLFQLLFDSLTNLFCSCLNVDQAPDI